MPRARFGQDALGDEHVVARAGHTVRRAHVDPVRALGKASRHREHPVGHLRDGKAGGLEVLWQAGVRLCALGQQVPDSLRPVPAAQHRPVGRVAHPLQDGLGRGFEANDRPARGQGFTIGRAQGRAPARRNDQARTRSQLGAGSGFQVTKRKLPVLREDRGNGFAGHRCDAFVEVDEGAAQPLGHQPSDARLARAHEAGQDDIVA